MSQPIREKTPYWVVAGAASSIVGATAGAEMDAAADARRELNSAALTLRGKIGKHNALNVEIAGLYWHFVDVVWIVIFTLVYLIP